MLVKSNSNLDGLAWRGYRFNSVQQSDLHKAPRQRHLDSVMWMWRVSYLKSNITGLLPLRPVPPCKSNFHRIFLWRTWDRPGLTLGRVDRIYQKWSNYFASCRFLSKLVILRFLFDILRGEFWYWLQRVSRCTYALKSLSSPKLPRSYRTW